MTRVTRVCVVMNALMLLAMSVHGTGAQGAPVKIIAAPVRVRGPVVNSPSTGQLGTIAQHQQNSSDWGVQTNIHHRRDRLQHAPKTLGTYTD
jgi:hypothetical protein